MVSVRLPPTRRIAPLSQLRYVSRESLSVQTILAALLVGLAGAYIAAFAIAGLLRLTYPFQLEGVEGAYLQQVQQIRQGLPLYTAPTLQHVPLVYGPADFYVAALIANVTGPTFFAPRLVSWLASLASIALLGTWVRRETGHFMPAVAAAGLFAASFPLVNTAMDESRVDGLFLFLTLAALYAARIPDLGAQRVWRLSAISATLLGLAVLTKQSALPMLLAVLAYFMFTAPRRLLVFVPVVVIVVGAPLLLLYLQSGPWLALYLWQLPRAHAIRPELLARFWTNDLAPYFQLQLLLLTPVFFVGRWLARDRRTVLFYGLVVLSLVVTSWITRANPGGGQNVLLPAYAALALLFGLALHEGSRQLSPTTGRALAFRGCLLGGCVLQFVLILAYNPRITVPYLSDQWADERLASTLSALPGTLFAPDYDAYLQGSGKGEQPYLTALGEFRGEYGGPRFPEEAQWLGQLTTALEDRRYDYVVLRPGSGLEDTVTNAGYADTGPLFPPGDEFWLWRSRVSTPNAEVFVPAERVNTSDSQS